MSLFIAGLAYPVSCQNSADRLSGSVGFRGRSGLFSIHQRRRRRPEGPGLVEELQRGTTSQLIGWADAEGVRSGAGITTEHQEGVTPSLL
jgi:hypothetical protein